MSQVIITRGGGGMWHQLYMIGHYAMGCSMLGLCAIPLLE